MLSYRFETYEWDEYHIGYEVEQPLQKSLTKYRMYSITSKCYLTI